MNGFNKFFLSGTVVALTDMEVMSGKYITSALIKAADSYKDASGEWKKREYFFDAKLFGYVRKNAINTGLSVGNHVMLEGKMSSYRPANGKLNSMSLDVQELEYIGDYEKHRYNAELMGLHEQAVKSCAEKLYKFKGPLYVDRGGPMKGELDEQNPESTFLNQEIPF